MTEISRDEFLRGLPEDCPLRPENPYGPGPVGAWATSDGMWAVVAPKNNPSMPDQFFFGETAWTDARRAADDRNIEASRRTR